MCTSISFYMGSIVSSLITAGASLGTAMEQRKLEEQLTRETNEANIIMTNATNQANKDIADSTNQANIDIANATNESNERIAAEANEFNAQQADLAYERSTAKSKMGELISAGLSPEQARMIIASQGASPNTPTASATSIPAVAPTLTPGAPMQSATMQKPDLSSSYANELQGIQALGKGFGSIADIVFDGISSPDGGFLGKIVSLPVLSTILEHIDEIPVEAMSDFQSFSKYIESHSEAESIPVTTTDITGVDHAKVDGSTQHLDIQDEVGNFIAGELPGVTTTAKKQNWQSKLFNSTAWKTVKRFPFAFRSIKFSYDSTVRDMALQKQSFVLSQATAEKETANAAVSRFNALISDTQGQVYTDNKQLLYNSYYYRLSNSVQSALLESSLWSDDRYKSFVFNKLLFSEGSIALANEYAYNMQALKNGALSSLQDVDQRLLGYFDLFNSIGLGSTKLGLYYLNSLSNGISLNSSVATLFNSIIAEYPNDPEIVKFLEENPTWSDIVLSDMTNSLGSAVWSLSNTMIQQIGSLIESFIGRKGANQMINILRSLIQQNNNNTNPNTNTTSQPVNLPM